MTFNQGNPQSLTAAHYARSNQNQAQAKAPAYTQSVIGDKRASERVASPVKKGRARTDAGTDIGDEDEIFQEIGDDDQGRTRSSATPTAYMANEMSALPTSKESMAARRLAMLPPRMGGIGNEAIGNGAKGGLPSFEATFGARQESDAATKQLSNHLARMRQEKDLGNLGLGLSSPRGPMDSPAPSWISNPKETGRTSSTYSIDQNAELPDPTPLNIRAAGFNVRDKEILRPEARPKENQTIEEWIPIVSNHLPITDVPSATRTKLSEGLSINSLCYNIEPPNNNQQAVFGMIRHHLRVERQWELEDLPNVRVQPLGAVTAVFIQFQKNSTSTRMGVELERFTVYDKTGDDEVRHDLRLVASGRKVRSEVFGADFRILDDPNAQTDPVTHRQACRIAGIFARSCHASQSLDYPSANTGVLGLWRQQIAESWPEGVVLRTDTNCFKIALWIPSSVEAKNFLPYHVDPVGNLKYAFSFPGSERFCKLHANNVLHPDNVCSKKICAKCNRKGHATHEHDEGSNLNVSRGQGTKQGRGGANGRGQVPSKGARGGARRSY